MKLIVCHVKKIRSGIFDSLIYSTRQNRMKDALWNAFN